MEVIAQGCQVPKSTELVITKNEKVSVSMINHVPTQMTTLNTIGIKSAEWKVHSGEQNRWKHPLQVEIGFSCRRTLKKSHLENME